MVNGNVEDDAAASGGDVAATFPIATAAVVVASQPPPPQPTTRKMTLATVYDALKELKDASWLATAKEAVAVATAAARKVEHVALDVNAIRDKSYEASVMALASAGSADAASALKLLRADMEGLKAVARRVDVRHAEDTLAFQTLRELQKHGRKTAAKVGELERQLKATHAAHAKEMAELREMVEEDGGGGRRRNRGGAAAAAVAADDSSLRPFQREARRRRRVRQLRLAEGLDDDPEALGEELEGLASGLDDHADALAALRSELARVDAARVADRLRLTLSAGARLLARALAHRRTLTLRQRLMTWRRHTRRKDHDDHQRGRGPGGHGGLGMRSVASQTRLAGQAQVLQSALARVNWAEIRMRPRFDKWRAWTERARYEEKWQPAFARCGAAWAALYRNRHVPRTASMWRQWRRVTALARCDLLALSDVSLHTQAARYLTTPAPAANATGSEGAAVAAEHEGRQARFLASVLRLLDDPSLAHDPDGRAAATALACRLLALRQGQLEGAKAKEKGSAAAQLHEALAAVGSQLQAQHEQLTGAVAAARRGAEEALEGYREQVARQLREAAVTADNKLASTKHRMAAVDTLLSDVQAVASRAEAAAAVASGRLEKVLLEHGEHTMRVAGLEQAHTQALVDRTAAERERRVLQHVTSEAVARLNDLTHASAAQGVALRADLDALAGAQHSLQGAVDGLGHRVQALGGDAAAVAARLATVEAVAAGLVERDPTGAELAALCVAFEDACLRAQGSGRGLPAVSFNMVLDLGVAAPLARLALRLAALVARLADEGVAVGAAAEPRHAPPPGAGPVPAGHGKMHTAGKDFALSVSLTAAAGPSPYDTHAPPPAPPTGSASATATTVVPGFGTLAVSTIGPAFAHTTATGPHHGPGAATAFAASSAALGPWAAPTAEEEVVRRRDLLLRAFEADFVAALHRLTGAGGGGAPGRAPGITRCEARVVFHRRFVAALELALSLHPVMAVDAPTALTRTSTGTGTHHYHGTGTTTGTATTATGAVGGASGGVHSTAQVVTRDVALFAAAPRTRPSSASSATGNHHHHGNSSSGTRPLSATHAQAHLHPHPSTSLAGAIEQQLAKGDLAAAAATVTLGTTTTHTTTGSSSSGGAGTGMGGWNASGAQACLACSRPLHDPPTRRAPASGAAACLAQLQAAFEAQTALDAVQDRRAAHSALAAGALVAAATSRGMQAQAVTGWAQGPHWPQHQHPDPAATTTGATKPRRPMSATAALGSRALPPAAGPSAEEKGDDGNNGNGDKGGVSARSSELRQLTAADDGASTLVDGHGSHVHHHQSDAHDVA